MRDSIIKRKSFAFSLKIIEIYQILKREKEFDIARQVLRSGTSIGANIEEALAGYSKSDFTAKMSIASKESREAYYWLKLIKESSIATPQIADELLVDCEELIKILTAIVKTSQQKLKS